MTDKGSQTTDETSAPGYSDGTIKTLSPEAYAQAVADRNAEEEVALEEDDDLSDLDELDEIVNPKGDEQ